MKKSTISFRSLKCVRKQAGAVRFHSLSLLSNNSRLQHDCGNENSHPTHTQIDFQTRGKHSSLLRPVFSVSGFDTDQMATLKPLMM